MKKGIIIAGFGAIGKTTLYNKYENVIDLESGDYTWDNTGLEDIPVEKRKGNAVKRDPNPDWPNNYFEAIMDAREKYDIILTSMHGCLLDYFNDNNISYYLAYPTDDCVDELVKRCYERGNNETFSEKLRKNALKWKNRLNEPKIIKVLYCTKDEYLEDILIKENLLITSTNK